MTGRGDMIWVFADGQWPSLGLGLRNAYASIVICSALVLLYRMHKKRNVPSNSIYGKTQAILNQPEETLWQNMGYWKDDSTTFRQACEELTSRLANMVGLNSKDTLLDIGYG